MGAFLVDVASGPAGPPGRGWYYTGRLSGLKLKRNKNLNLAPPGATPRIVPRAEHTISRSAISPNALKVLYRLKEAGYQSFLVGGSVRDLLLGLRPKDFDIATNALPDEVRSIFRNCRLIGRRFRLAHVYFGQDVVEVATFRAAHEEDEERDEDDWRAREPEGQRVLDARGRILRDNVYGTVEEDVWRRDFTANALYYNIADFSVWDFVDGVRDVEARQLRLIGDPVTRYHEDPVRMLRAVRFAAKLEFSIDTETERPLLELGYLLTHVPPARLFDEIMKLFLGGFGARALALLRQYGLLEQLFPLTVQTLARDPEGPATQLMMRGVESTDRRIAADKPVTPTFLFAMLLFAPIMARARNDSGGMDSHSLLVASEDVVREQQGRVSIPRRFTLPMRDMFALQARFLRREGRKSLALLHHPRFRAAYDLLMLRCEVGLEDPEVGKWWTEIQTATPAERDALTGGAQAATGVGTRRPRRRRRRRRPPLTT
jgi:poly(A) polymerase